MSLRNRCVCLDGKNCHIIRETLSDNSLVYNIGFRHGETEIECTDYKSANTLFELIESDTYSLVEIVD